MSRLGLLTVVLVLLLPTPPAPGAATPTELLRARVDECLAELRGDGGIEMAASRMDVILDQALAYLYASKKADRELFTDVAYLRRLLHLLAGTEPSRAAERLEFLLENDTLGRTLVFLIEPPADDPDEVLGMLDQLRAAHGEELVAKYATLSAAISVVHDEPLSYQVNENRAEAPNPLDIFEFFVRHEGDMMFGVGKVPAEVLVFVVDTTVSIEEMQWALQRYAGNQNVGERFFDIEYDFEHLRTRRPKACTLAGWTLPAILEHGGICADQAHFATSVGKAIGVPTAYAVGKSSEVGHAWVGFMQSTRGGPAWNFDAGRYDAYQGVRGVIRDPQTRHSVPDSYVALLADVVNAPAAERWFAAAMTDAATRLREIEAAGETLSPPRLSDDAKTRRSATIEHQLMLLQAGLEACPGYADGWFAVRQLGADGALSLKQKKEWATFLHRLCGQRYPDFYFVIVKPMIETVEDLREQDKLWDSAYRAFRGRDDLAAAVRMEQAEMWAEAGHVPKAGQHYLEIIMRYGNSGRFVLSALLEAEKLARESSGDAGVTELYRRAWNNIRPPDPSRSGAFYRQGNWYRVGLAYAERLDRIGERAEANRVRQRLSQP